MKLLAGSFAALFLSLSAQAADCTFTQLEIVPQFGSPNMFGGEDEHVRVMFSNEDPNDDNPDAFPEPPVYLADRVSGNDCRIEDGGIWSRGGVFLSQDGRRVLMHELAAPAPSWCPTTAPPARWCTARTSPASAGRWTRTGCAWVRNARANPSTAARRS